MCAPPAAALPALPPPSRRRGRPAGSRAGRGRERSGPGGEEGAAPPADSPPCRGTVAGSRWPRVPTCRRDQGICFTRSWSITRGVLVAPKQQHRQPSTPRAQPVPQERQPVILPLLPKAEEMRDLRGGEQPPLMEKDGVSAPFSDAGAFPVHQGWPWPLIFGQERRKKGAIFTAACGLPQEGLSPRHRPQATCKQGWKKVKLI